MTHYSSHTHACAKVILLGVLLLLLITGCQRRELYVYGDEFYSVTLNVDWRDLSDSDPDGMTTWFYPIDETTAHLTAEEYTNNDRESYRNTTASVRQQSLYLPNGRYQGLVVSYSPDEYSRQAFYDMDDIHQARVVATPSSYQVSEMRIPGNFISDKVDNEVKTKLYGEPAWNEHLAQRPELRDSGYYTITNQPEPIGADTLDNRPINSGTEFDDYIPWKERDNYQSSINVQTLQATPHTLVWTVRIRIFVKTGLDYMWQARASLAGLADGHFLPRHKNTENTCLISLDEWKKEKTGENQGWITCTFTSFGLRPSTVKSTEEYHPSTTIGKSLFDGRQCDLGGYFSNVNNPEDLRLNIAFILRDQRTIVSRHYNVGHSVCKYNDQLVLRLDLDRSFLGEDIVLPKVDAYEGADFGADVTPWVDTDPVDVPM